MLHLLIEQGVPVSHVVYFETEWDFPQMRAHLDMVTAKTGLRIIRVRYYRYFEEMLALWGWPKSAGGWCTARKHRTCLKYIGHIKGDKTEYIGFSADEVKRTQTKWMKERRWPVKFPLIEAGMGEADDRACQDLGLEPRPRGRRQHLAVAQSRRDPRRVQVQRVTLPSVGLAVYRRRGCDNVPIT